MVVTAIIVAICSPAPRSQQFDGEFRLQSGQLGIPGASSFGSNHAISSQVGNVYRHVSGENYVIASPFAGAVITEQIRFLSGLTDTIGGTDWVLAFNLPENASGVACSLMYRPGGAHTFKTIPFNQNSSNTRSISLNPDSIEVRGLEFLIVLSDDSNRASIGTETKPLTLPSQGYASQPVTGLDNTPFSYQMISVPIEPGGKAESIFTETFGEYDPTHWRLGRYDSHRKAVREFPDVPIPRPGISYWLVSKTVHPITVEGVSVVPNARVNSEPYYSLPLDSGWNQIANPFSFEISVSDLRFEKSGLFKDAANAPVDDSIYGHFGGRFRTLRVLSPWLGFFLHANEPGLNILFPFEEFDPAADTPVPGIPRQDNAEWYFRLSIETVNGRDLDKFVGVHSEADNGLDRFDYTDPPPPKSGAHLSLQLAGSDETRFRSDFREPGRENYTFKLLVSTWHPANLRITASDLFPANWSARLSAGDQILSDNALLETVLIEPGKYELSLVVGQQIEGRSQIPTEFALHQNYPNPFNPSTTIQFDLPKAADCLLEIINILGRTVYQTSRRELSAGRHTFVWDGKNSDGQPVASGLYFFRFKTDGFAASKKMVLLR